MTCRIQAKWSLLSSTKFFTTCKADTTTVADTAFIRPKGLFLLIFYYIVHPLRIMIFYTVPDVKVEGGDYRAILSTIMCVAWMAIQTFVIIRGLDLIGIFITVDGAIIGLTAGAWASSYPALWSSLVVARDGYGDIASCNAFGSNVFNNFLGLGLPWVTYSLLNDSTPFVGMQDTGVVVAFIALNAILVASYGVIAFNDFELHYW